MINDLMLDLETAGKKPGCAILSIALVPFDPFSQIVHQNQGDGFYRNVNLLSSLFNGFTISNETMEWWSRHDEAAKKALLESPHPIEDVLLEASSYIQSSERIHGRAPKIWAKSPEFDCSILRHAFEVFTIKVPWSFRDQMDVRTAIAIGEYAGNVMPDVNKALTKHNAIDDCLFQIMQTQAALKDLKHGSQKAETLEERARKILGDQSKGVSVGIEGVKAKEE